MNKRNGRQKMVPRSPRHIQMEATKGDLCPEVQIHDWWRWRIAYSIIESIRIIILRFIRVNAFIRASSFSIIRA